jgi:HAD superfamily hydrolase (TIGR01509 family)
MDGVLVDSRAIVERTWRRWAERHGVEAGRLLRLAHGRRTQETLQATVPHLALPEELAWLEAAELADLEGLAEVPGAARLLRTLPEVPWAVVTSAGPELARRRLAAAGLPPAPVLVSAKDVDRGKPAPDGYLLAAERLAVPSARAVVFEDSPAGIAAALSAGSKVIGIATTHAASQLRGAVSVVTDLTSVTVERNANCWRIVA